MDNYEIITIDGRPDVKVYYHESNGEILGYTRIDDRLFEAKSEYGISECEKKREVYLKLKAQVEWYDQALKNIGK